MIYYAIADIHGRYDLLTKAFDAIHAHADGRDHKIITLGDYIDRGPNSREVIRFLMDQDGIICLAGNHELWMRDIWHRREHPGEWLACGGDQTLYSYGHPKLRRARYGEDVRMKAIYANHVEWIDTLPLYHETEHHVFVHAGCIDVVPLSIQKEGILTWMLYPENGKADIGYMGKHVVHGHHQFPDGPILLSRRTNLDTGAFHTNRLAVAVLSGAGGPKEIITINGD